MEEYNYEFQPNQVQPEYIPPKKPVKQWAIKGLALLLVALIAFGGGYAGYMLAQSRSGKVVINQSNGSGNTAAQVVSVSDIAASIEPSVVAITTEQMTTGNFWYGTQVTSGAGSGVIISEDGYILTCAHVISGADNISVETSDGKIYSASVVGSYVQNDIAVIKIDATGLTPAIFADSDQLKQGDGVLAVGNPEGTLSGTITSGIVSALNREISVAVEGTSQQNMFGQSAATTQTITLNVIQTDAAVSPGNSGGGLFNLSGELVGIVSAKSSDSDSEGLGFAIPSNTALEIAEQLMENGSYTDPNAEETASIGISVVQLSDTQAAQYGYKTGGVYVTQITSDKAKDAGLKEGDRLVSFNENTVSSIDDLTSYLKDCKAGDKVKLSVERDGKLVSVEVELS